MLFADIVVDISAKELDRPFQYRVPESIEGDIDIGSRVEIPFGRGNTLKEGYVINLSHTPSFDENKLKDIKGIVKRSLTPEERLLRTANWIRNRCGSNLSDAIKAVMPVKMEIKQKDERTVIIDASKEELEETLNTAVKRHYKAQEKCLKTLIDIKKKYTPKDGESSPHIKYDEIKKINGIDMSVLRALEKKKIIRIDTKSVFRDSSSYAIEEKINSENELVLNEGQKIIVEDVIESYDNGDLKPHLIHGITGSGKTFVYIKIIEEMLKRGKQVIVLIPEIALTYQTVKRFKNAFGDRCETLHSKLSHGERYDRYIKAKNGLVDIMIGPRSALFTPFENLGMIVVDEEHETSYRNDYPPKYHARQVAEYIAQDTKSLLLLGSATPSLESYYRCKQGQIKLHELKERAVPEAKLPRVHITDLREELKKNNRSIFGSLLYNLIKDRLRKKEQIMLFINRRGYSGFVSCRSCGAVEECPNCSVSLKAHVDEGKLRLLKCHYCGFEKAFPRKCSVCGSNIIGTFGTGTQKVEEMIHKAFPEARVLRMDRDTTGTKGAHDEILKKFGAHEADILVGTQMIVKGHDFSHVTLMGILAADMSLNVSDYEAYERTFELLVQASGRAGRGEEAGDVVIQTYQPENPAVSFAIKNDYEAFYESEIVRRKSLHYPPVSHILEILCLGKVEAELKEESKYIADMLKKKEAHVLGPTQDIVYKMNNTFRYKIYVKSPNDKLLMSYADIIREDMKKRMVNGVIVQFKL